MVSQSCGACVQTEFFNNVTIIIRPGDNPNQCSQGYSCPPPTLTIDPFVPFGSRFIDVGAGGPNPFTFTASSNVSWLNLSPNKGSVSPSNPETRVFASVDWSQVSGVEYAIINFDATVPGQPGMIAQAYFVANKTIVPSDFKGKVINLLPWSDSHHLMNFRIRGGRWGYIH